MGTTPTLAFRYLCTAAMAAVFACGPPEVNKPTPNEPPKIATTERGPRGARLVFVSEQGVRLAELTRSLEKPALDNNPAWSPRGDVIVFARASGDELDRPRLHIVEARTGAEPRPLIKAAGRQRDPRWFPDGRSLLFSSDASGSFDLYQQDLETDAKGALRASGEPRRLTRGPGQELSGSVSADGKTIVFMEISGEGGASRLRRLALDGGEVHSLTAGPLDVTPAFNPEKPAQLAFASRADGRNDMDLFLLDVETGEQTPLPAEPMADLTGPVWSVDGRHLFATAVFRSVSSGDAILSSVVVIDTFAEAPRWRALHDPAFTESRIGVALAPRVFLPSLIDANRPYAEALELAIEQHLIRREKK